MVMKTIDPASAASLYANTAGVATRTAAGGDGVNFSDFLKQKVSDTIETLRAGESMSAKAVTGEADITDVVQAVNAAESALQTVVALRDRLIGAYQEIMRMPI